MKNKKIEFVSILIGFFSAFAISIAFLELQGYDAIQSISVLITSAFGSDISLSIWRYRSTLLMLTGLSASITFIGGNVNLGQQGTLIVSVITTLYFGQILNFPSFIQIPLLLILASLAACLWNGILLIFRFKLNMNEMIGSLMFNFIARYLLTFLTAGYFLKKGSTSIQSLPISETSIVSNIGAFVAVIILVLLCYFFIEKHYLGYEIRLKGENPFFTRLSGCSNKKIIFISTIIASSCAGIAGAYLLMGNTQNYYVQGLEGNFGWDGIMISMMAANNILLVPVYALFFAMLQTGSVGMEVITKVPSEFTLIFQGITVFCVIATKEISRSYLTRINAIKQQKNTNKEKR